MIPEQNVCLANFSAVPAQPVVKQDHLDMPPPRAYLNLFYISYKNSPNLEDTKKLHNPDAFIPISSSRELYNLLNKRHTLVGRSAFLIPLWGLHS